MTLCKTDSFDESLIGKNDHHNIIKTDEKNMSFTVL